jgi:protein-tyrosine-phosphatase
MPATFYRFVSGLGDTKLYKNRIFMKICFICSANACRSYVLQVLFNHYASLNNIEATASSAGVFAKRYYEVPQKIKDYLNSKGVQSAPHTPKFVSRQDLELSDLILVMENMHYELLIDKYPQFSDKIRLFNDYIFNKEKDVEDPISKNGSKFVKSMEFLDGAVKVLIEKIIKE